MALGCGDDDAWLASRWLNLPGCSWKVVLLLGFQSEQDQFRFALGLE